MQTLPTFSRLSFISRATCTKTLCGVALMTLVWSSYAAPVRRNTTATTNATEMHMYRYTSDDGALVTSNTITPEYARKGYQIVTVTGVVLSTVAPEPTPEERAKLAEQAKDKLSAEQQKAHDKDLLLRYNSVDDINIAKKRRLEEINNQIALLSSNVSSLQSQMDTEHQRAAVYERNGQPVPQTQLDKISDLQTAITVTEDQVKQRQQDLADETARFDKDTQRLIQLNKSLGK